MQPRKSFLAPFPLWRVTKMPLYISPIKISLLFQRSVKFRNTERISTQSVDDYIKTVHHHFLLNDRHGKGNSQKMSVSEDYQNLEEAKLINAMRSNPVWFVASLLHIAEHLLSETESVV